MNSSKCRRRGILSRVRRRGAWFPQDRGMYFAGPYDAADQLRTFQGLYQADPTFG